MVYISVINTGFTILTGYTTTVTAESSSAVRATGTLTIIPARTLEQVAVVTAYTNAFPFRFTTVVTACNLLFLNGFVHTGCACTAAFVSARNKCEKARLYPLPRCNMAIACVAIVASYSSIKYFNSIKSPVVTCIINVSNDTG
jgi:hypothetical protein